MFRTDLLKDKRILITGGGTGLGKAMARRFLELGAVVYICGRREAVLREAAMELSAATGGQVHFMACDIRVAQAVDEMIESIWRDGPLDGLVNNAAGNFIAQTEKMSRAASMPSPISCSMAASMSPRPAASAGYLPATRPA